MMPIERHRVGNAHLRGASSAGARMLGDRTVAQAVVIAATLFNAVLALGNAHGLPVNSGVVIGSEMLLTGAALVLGFHGQLPVTQAWIGLCALIALFALANGFGTGRFDPKFVRDVLIIPVFVLLGLRCSRGDVIRVVMILQGVVLIIMVFEALRPEDFGRLFNVIGYYVNTRGFQTDDFWNQNSDLFVSATRPGERFLFGSLGIHRLSSVFLEPVSLGNHCVVVAIVAAALWSSLSGGQRWFVVVSEAMILVGSDGRFATVAIGFVMLVRVLAPRLPRYSNALYLPGVIAAAALAVAVFGIPPGGDDFPGRASGSVHVLMLMGLSDLLGFSTSTAYQVMDSGIAYLLFSQSLLGTMVIWGFVTLGLPQTDRASTIAAHGVAVYAALLLLISYSLFSIKTGALLWFSFGAIANPAGLWQGGRAAAARTAGLAGRPA